MNTSLGQIKPETIAAIESLAGLSGLSVDDYLRSLLPPGEMDMSLRPDAADGDFEADIDSFSVMSDDRPIYNGTYGRDDVYFDHD